MTTAPENKGAYITEPKKHPMEVLPSPYYTANAGELVVKVAAAAVNPADWMIQVMGPDLFDFIKYPFVGGCDVAGTVVEVGEGVTKFKKGDRVIALCADLDQRCGGYQHYVAVEAKITAPIPDDLSFTEACVIPLGVSTAACGLYQKDYLALELPKLAPTPKGKTLLVWAGSSSVGSNAIQLAVASGYEVFTTCSPKNFEFCKSLGAARVFDYKSPTITEELIEAFKGKTCAGAFAIFAGSEKVVYEVVRKSQGSKFVATVMPVTEVPDGIQAKMVFGSEFKDNEVGTVVWGQYLPAALAQKKFRALPKPLVIGHGLEHVQEALDRGKAGEVSAQKMVITL